MLSFFFVGENDSPVSNDTVSRHGNTYILTYPCSETNKCKNYYSYFPPGRYQISLYGASGGSSYGYASTALKTDHSDCINQDLVSKYGGNTFCNKLPSIGGAGGYSSGILKLLKQTKVFISIGGTGQFIKGTSSYDTELRPKGGYNGGGDGALHVDGSGGGGGATDFRLIENDLWHRILVAGGGGGSDNPQGTFNDKDDGSGGAGGGKEAQGFWINGEYNGDYIAGQTSGFTFGNGESSMEIGSSSPHGVASGSGSSDRPGAGGGWFGGYAGHYGNGGSGGGSSFAFTSDAQIPDGSITSYDSYYENDESHAYAFDKSKDRQYLLQNPIIIQGIWSGNGKAIIIYHPIECSYSQHFSTRCSLFLLFLLF